MVRLEGRVAGPWVEVLRRVWVDTAPGVGSRKLSIDLRDVTYVDAGGKRVLANMYGRQNVELLTGSTWTQYLAKEIAANSENSSSERSENGNDA